MTPPDLPLTRVVLHHDGGHASVAGVAGLVAMAVGVRSVHVGHIALVLGQGGGELHVGGTHLLPSPPVFLWRQLSPALRTFLRLLFLEALLRPWPLLLPFPVALSLPVVLPPVLLLRFRSFGVFVGVDVRPQACVRLLQRRRNVSKDSGDI